MQQAVPVSQRRDGMEETHPVMPIGDGVRKEGIEQAVRTLASVFGSADPETAFLEAITNGLIPDDVCLELAKHFGELIKAQNLNNRLQVAFALGESNAISDTTQKYLLLVAFEMYKPEEAKVKVGDKPTEAETIQAPTLESPAPAPQAPSVNDLIRSATELQARFGANPPEEKLSEIRQAVAKLTEEERASLRQTLGSAILAEAEVPADQRQVNVPASLEVVEILLGQRQRELTTAAFAAYETIVGEGFQLTHRNEFDRPLMTVSSMTLLRNRLRRWLDSHEPGLGKEVLAPVPSAFGGAMGQASAQKAVATLEGFLLAAADERTKKAIQHDRLTRLRERIIHSWVRVLDAVNEEMVIAQPATKEGALRQVQGYLEAQRQELTSELRLAGGKLLCEAKATIWQVFNLQSATTALRREMAGLEASDYNPLSQRPALTDRDKRLVIFESERATLVLDYRELSTAFKSPELKGNERKKTAWQLDEITSKLEDLNQLIAAFRAAPPELPALEVRCV